MKYILNFEKLFEAKIKFKTHDVDGFIVYQGKDADSNDHVTFELSKEDDYWFHAKGVPGSHVLIKVNQKIPTEAVIKKAAQIAAKNSQSKLDDVLVIYCKKQFVKKEPGMNPGQVKVDEKNAYTITVSKI